MNNVLKKVLPRVLLSLLIVSVIINIAQYREIYERNLNSYKMAEYCMENYESYFLSAFNQKDSTSISNYIKNPDNLSTIIEGIQSAEFYYFQAMRYMSEYPGKISKTGTYSITGLLDLYLIDLKSYRNCLEKNNVKLYKGNINVTMEDLLTIRNWMQEQYMKKDFKAYDGTDFMNNVYNKLKSNFKKYVPGAPLK